ncbi:MAG TPA: hypothetical protein VFM69_04435 [Pricia sp.]|nr:hypothetical protein [Pricia sp.]
MAQKIDKKESDEDTKFVKEEKEPTRDYIFQKTGITKTGFIIIVIFLIVLVVGLAVSGIFFEVPWKNP